MKRLRTASLLLGLGALVVFMALSAPGRVAQADVVAPIQGTLQVHKHCDPAGLDPTFDVDLVVAVDVVPLGPGVEDETFTADFTIDCDQTRTVANPATDVDFSAFFTAFAANAAGAWAGANYSISVTEQVLAPWWVATYADNDGVVDTDCNVGPLSLAALTTQLGGGYVCTITNTLVLGNLSFLEVNKVFDGDPAATFTFLVETSGDHCMVVIDDGAPLIRLDGETFTITPGQVADVYCSGENTVTEQPGGGFTFVEVVCDDGEPDVTIVGAAVTFRLATFGDASPCTWTNTAEVTEDDPALPNIEVTKICIDAPADVADFDITIGELTEAVPCNGTTSVVDLEPATYAVSEGDNDAAATAIFCGDDPVVVGTSTEVTIPDEGAVDVFCVIINSFDPDEGALDDLICSCTCCGGLELDIDINNGNTNTIGIDNDNLNNNANNNDNANTNDNDNENKNDNVNENTQDQDNTQDQNNTNDQTNNITSSPEVNIDFGH